MAKTLSSLLNNFSNHITISWSTNLEKILIFAINGCLEESSRYVFKILSNLEMLFKIIEFLVSESVIKRKTLCNLIYTMVEIILNEFVHFL